jgi:hypothetical protein
MLLIFENLRFKPTIQIYFELLSLENRRKNKKKEKGKIVAGLNSSLSAHLNFPPARPSWVAVSTGGAHPSVGWRTPLQLSCGAIASKPITETHHLSKVAYVWALHRQPEATSTSISSAAVRWALARRSVVPVETNIENLAGAVVSSESVCV